MLGESLNILTYDIAMYTRVNVEKTANSQVHLDAHSDYSRGFSSMPTVWLVRGFVQCQQYG